MSLTHGAREPRTWVALVLGAAVLAVLGFVPYLSAVVAVLVLLFGFGAWLLFIWRQYARARTARSETAPVFGCC